MLHLISRMIGDEMADARRRLSGIVVILGAFVLILVAVVFALVALYLVFSEIMPAWQAALAVGGLVFAAGLVLLFTGRSMSRRHIRYSRRMGADMRTFVDAFADGGKSDRDKEDGDDTAKADWILGAVAIAAVAGLILGRRLTK